MVAAEAGWATVRRHQNPCHSLWASVTAGAEAGSRWVPLKGCEVPEGAGNWLSASFRSRERLTWGPRGKGWMDSP